MIAVIAVGAPGARAAAAFDLHAAWNDRITRYEQTAEVRVTEFGAHRDDENLE